MRDGWRHDLPLLRSTGNPVLLRGHRESLVGHRFTNCYAQARNQSRTDFELAIESRLDYVSGACLAITPDFLDRAGFMDEGYFLYYEELDWAARIPPHLHIGYAADAIVYHKEGAAIGGKTKGPSRKSLVADRYAARNRVLFTRRWKPSALPVVLTVIALAAVWRMVRGKFTNAVSVTKGAIEGLSV